MIRASLIALSAVLAGCNNPPSIDVQLTEHAPIPRERTTDDPNRPLAELYRGGQPSGGAHHGYDPAVVGEPDYTPKEECDGDDDDGDGRIDEGWVEPEWLDGEDNDCDGDVDESTVGAKCGKNGDCSADLKCIEGRCTTSCHVVALECADCVAHYDDGQTMMDPNDCDAICEDYTDACVDAGGRCIVDVCERPVDPHGCPDGGVSMAIEIATVENERVAREWLDVCRMTPLHSP